MILSWLRLGMRHCIALPRGAAFQEVASGAYRLFVGAFLGMAASRTDNLLVAGAIGETRMSFYSVAWNTSRLPLVVLDRMAAAVLTPTVARIRDDTARVQRALDQTLRYSYLVVGFAGGALFVTVPLFVEVALGPHWRPLVPCVRIMSLGCLVAPVQYASVVLLVSYGRAHWIGATSAMLLLFQVAAIPPVAQRWGSPGAALVDLAAVALVTTGLWWAARTALPDLQWRLRRPFSLSVVSALSVGLAAASVGVLPISPLQQLSVQIGVFCLGYPLVIALSGGRSHLEEVWSWVIGEKPGMGSL